MKLIYIFDKQFFNIFNFYIRRINKQLYTTQKNQAFGNFMEK